MKKQFAFLISFILLTGCASNTPKLTPQELAAKRRVTLNIYDDNRVAIRVLRPNDYPSLDYWSWNEDKSVALVFSTGAEYYNALDLIKITKGPEMTAYLKDGTKKTFPKMNFAVFWCKADKQCSYTSIGSMKVVYEMNLREAPKRDPKWDTERISTFTPWRFDNDIVILDNAGYTELNRRVENLYQRWAAATPAREAAVLAKAEHEVTVREQAINAGQTNCTSTSYNCSGSYSNATALNCGTFQSSVGEMTKNGWVAANVSSERVQANLAEMCDHNVYHFYYKR